MPTVAHLSDIHFPVIGERGWTRRWENVVARVRAEKPDLIVVTGDLINSARPQFRARPRLKSFLNHLRTDAFEGFPIVVVPGNHDIKSIQGLGPRDEDFAAEFQKLTGDRGGWHTPIADRIHLFTIDSNHSSWFARGRILDRELEKAAIPPDCSEKHLHVFGLHHSILVEPRREGESSLTTGDGMLGLDDPARLLSTIAALGFDLVLHGHRHLSTFQLYSDPRAHLRSRSCFLVGAPSATKKLWQGFNLIEVQDDGVFEVHAVRQSQGAWLDRQLVASRDYEETRARRWRQQLSPLDQAFCDSVDVVIKPYAEGNSQEKNAQKIGGDVRVEATFHMPRRLSARLPFPLTSVIPYKGVVWREVSATWTSTAGYKGGSLHVHEDRSIDVTNVGNPRWIRISAVLLNAIPTEPGDWSRMQASQPSLQDVIDVRLALPARFLRLRVDLPRLRTLQPIARRLGAPGALWAESDFALNHTDAARDRCHQQIMIFRPPAGIGHCLTPSGDPVIGDALTSLPNAVAVLQQKLVDLRTSSSEVAVHVQQRLDRLKEEVIALASALPNATGSGDDISVDLLCITTEQREDGGVQVVMTDRMTEARLWERHQKIPGDIKFPWGLGVAGRALRLQQWLTWKKDKYSTLNPFEWPARDWYVEVHGEHTYIYCGPLTTRENGKEYMVGMLSFASQEEPSLLKHVISAIQAPETNQKFNVQFGEAVSKFSVWLGLNIVRELDDNEGNDGNTTEE